MIKWELFEEIKKLRKTCDGDILNVVPVETIPPSVLEQFEGDVLNVIYLD